MAAAKRQAPEPEPFEVPDGCRPLGDECRPLGLRGTGRNTRLTPSAGGCYFFNPDNFIELFAQTNDAIDKVNVQAVWVWRFLPPFGSLQVAYQTGTSERGEVSEQGDTLFSKLSWVF